MYTMALSEANVRLACGPISAEWARSGIATIAQNASTAVISDTNITATSVVMTQIIGAATDSALTTIERVQLGTGSFTIVGNDNAAAVGGVKVAWAILAY